MKILQGNTFKTEEGQNCLFKLCVVDMLLTEEQYYIIGQRFLFLKQKRNFSLLRTPPVFYLHLYCHSTCSSFPVPCVTLKKLVRLKFSCT